ncbi:LysR substrate-binding domain-containing protein [Streptomyces bobili]|uniref:LysR substrate-binding domain-containing protein n=2 Tax=Streptomyces TaxID=1883 RepID=UPI003799ADE6
MSLFSVATDRVMTSVPATDRPSPHRRKHRFISSCGTALSARAAAFRHPVSIAVQRAAVRIDRVLTSNTVSRRRRPNDEGRMPPLHPCGTRRRVLRHPSHPGPVLTQGRALAACARSGFVPAPLTEVGETSTHVVFAAAGHGVALVPESVQRLRLDRVVHVPLAETETVTRGLARRQQRNPRATERTAVMVEQYMSSGTRQP